MGSGKNYLKIDLRKSLKQVKTSLALHLDVKEHDIGLVLVDSRHPFVYTLAGRANFNVLTKVLNKDLQALPTLGFIVDDDTFQHILNIAKNINRKINTVSISLRGYRKGRRRQTDLPL